MACLAIRGHETRGSEVIACLEVLGGTNLDDYRGDDITAWYFINKNEIDWCHECTEESNFIGYTFEEFEEKFPYKVGDKVFVNGYFGPRAICEMMWDDKSNQIKYGIGVGEWFDKSQLISGTYKLTMEVGGEELCQLVSKIRLEDEIPEVHFGTHDKVELVLGNEFEIKEENGKTYAVRKPLRFPNSYEECCEVLGVSSRFGFWELGDEFDLLDSFVRLKRCRDAYWKIIGDWKPDWNNSELKHVIKTIGTNLVKTTEATINCFFAFPEGKRGEEICYVFYENFKDDLNVCKELL